MNIIIYEEKQRVSDDRLKSIPLFHEEFSLAVHPHDPVPQKSSLPLEKLKSMNMVLFPADHQCRALIDRFCMEKGFRLKPHLETTTLASLLRMVQNGIGATVLPYLLLASLESEEIRIVRLNQPVPSQDICLIYRSDRYVGYAMRTFIQTLRETIESVIRRAKSS